MRKKQIKVLFIIDTCNPEQPSVPLIGFKYLQSVSRLCDVTLVTHERNRESLEKVFNEIENRQFYNTENQSIERIYTTESTWMKRYYHNVPALFFSPKLTIWPIHNVLKYPIHIEFDLKVFWSVQKRITAGEFDIVHVLTPMEPRYPFKVIEACQQTPFLLGPVNGGVPFPKAFAKKGRQEYSYFNFLRTVGRWLVPGYVKTYRRADRILAGSSYTHQNLIKTLGIHPDRIQLVYENGIDPELISTPTPSPTDQVRLLFVGRLVPYKSADMLLEALAQIKPEIRSCLHLTVVGDGSERKAWEDLSNRLGLSHQVEFTGWVAHQQVRDYYRRAHIFCFPSIREYGGGVVLEAMGAGLPCIVVNNGGIGEYVTDKTGFRIEPQSHSYVVQGLCDHITTLVEQPHLRDAMASAAIERARQFTWPRKAEDILAIYHQLLAKPVPSPQPSTAPALQ
jgi:glycosyltransferase involved in cell wall biosynthesis